MALICPGVGYRALLNEESSQKKLKGSHRKKKMKLSNIVIKDD